VDHRPRLGADRHIGVEESGCRGREDLVVGRELVNDRARGLRSLAGRGIGVEGEPRQHSWELVDSRLVEGRSWVLQDIDLVVLAEGHSWAGWGTGPAGHRSSSGLTS